MEIRLNQYDYPVKAALPELFAALREKRRAVLAAPPGTGKTTLTPPMLLDEFPGRVVMLEPRRLAAKLAASRIAAMLNETVGETVGYRMRGESVVGKRSRIEVVTEGILTRLIQADPELAGVDVLIFDEFHERNLAGDLGLALALNIQASLRPDLAVLIMSATLDAGKIAALLDGAPVVEATGRLFPVAEHFGESFGDLRRLPERAAGAVKNLLPKESGSFLVFLPGAREIELTAELLAGCGEEVLIVPLYGNLDRAGQERAILPPPAGCRKVVLATNIAESSLTIEGVRVVVDSGYERVNRFDAGSGMSRLETVRISRASAVQRAGRAGRHEPGAVYRLYSEYDFQHLSPFAKPEIRDAELTGLLLELRHWGSPPEQLRWLDPPPPAALKAATELLVELGAAGEEGKLTALGRRLAMLPVHPRVGVMLLRAAGLALAPLAAELAALLEERELLPDADTADITERLRFYRRRPGAFRRLDAVRDQLCRLLKVRFVPQGEQDCGLLLAFAFPDWIGKARGKLSSCYLLAGGRGARLKDTDDLRKHEFLAVCRLDRGEGDAFVRLAAPLPEADIRRHFADRLTGAESVCFDVGLQRITAAREVRLGAVVLSRAPLGTPPPEQAAKMLAGAVRSAGLQVLQFDAAAWNLIHRVRFAARLNPESYPDWSEAGIAGSLEKWLLRLPEARSFSDFRRLDWRNFLAGELGYSTLAKLEREYPERFTVPTGSKIRIDYDADTPTLPVRVQELYGLTLHPSLGAGRLPLKLELLSPAGRPIQITSDLPGFWRSNWAMVRKEMRARYPKHAWPEDPAAAAPVTRARPGN